MSWFEHGTSRIYYEEFGNGSPVLLLPGFSDEISEYPALIDSIVESGYRAIAADLPGSGRSKPQPRVYPVSYYQDDAHSFYAFVEQVIGQPTHLIGFSDGGEVALLMAVLEPAIVRSIVTWGSLGRVPEETRPMAEAIANVVDNPIEQLQGYSDRLKASYGEAIARAMTQNFATAIGAIMDKGGDISFSRANTITCPILLITGENDFLATPLFLSQLAAQIPSSEMVVVDGVGHNVYAERPEWLIQTILDWLAEQ